MQEHILSNEEIIRLKHYIDQKHQGLNPQQKASILANAVHRIIESRLPSFSDVVKQQIRGELLMKNSELFQIEVDDVIQQCMSLDLNREEVLSPLAAWVVSKSATPLQEEVVRLSLVQRSQQPIFAEGLQVMELAVSSETSDRSRGNKWMNSRLAIQGLLFFTIVILIMLIPPIEPQSSASAPYIKPIDMLLPVIDENIISRLSSGIPTELRYAPVDTGRLYKYLRDRNSMLAEEPYMSAIIKAGKQYDIHPLLLFAITGQEQGFVPKSMKKAGEIANNPFNVFGSWVSYNTSIEASAAIAAKTVANVSSRRPEDKDPMQWLNQTYAEDPNWWKGVTWFFDEMLREVEDDSFKWKD